MGVPEALLMILPTQVRKELERNDESLSCVPSFFCWFNFGRHSNMREFSVFGLKPEAPDLVNAFYRTATEVLEKTARTSVNLQAGKADPVPASSLEAPSNE